MQEFGSEMGLMLQAPQHHGRGHGGMLFLNATHHHAKMLCLDDDPYPQSLRDLQHSLSNLLREALLDLQTPCVHIDNASHFRQPDDGAIGDVSNVTFANKRQQMMFTQGVEFDLLHQYHFIGVARK